MESITQKRTYGISSFGIFLILLGIGLVLNKLGLIHHNWKLVLWVCLAALGFLAVVQAFVFRRRGVVFWGSLLFFVSVVMLVHRLELLEFAPWDVPATFSTAIGLSFLMLFFYDPSRIGVLIPALFFSGYGVLYYLWWCDIIDWYDLKYYLHTYWPVLIILWGLSLIFRPRKTISC